LSFCSYFSFTRLGLNHLFIRVYWVTFGLIIGLSLKILSIFLYLNDTQTDTKSWGEFSKLVGIEALTAVEAQKKENVAIRTKQIEMGLQAARKRGLGEWAVRVAGRSFVRLEELKGA
jgi:hypothetical protein